MDLEGHSYSQPPEANVANNLQNVSQISMPNIDRIYLFAIEKHPVIYDADHPGYKRRGDTEDAWETAVKQAIDDFKLLCENDFSPETVESAAKFITVQNMKHRWRLLRQYFSAERIRREAADFNPDQKGGFSLFEDMQFIAKHIAIKKPSKRGIRISSVPANSSTVKKMQTFSDNNITIVKAEPVGSNFINDDAERDRDADTMGITGECQESINDRERDKETQKPIGLKDRLNILRRKKVNERLARENAETQIESQAKPSEKRDQLQQQQLTGDFDTNSQEQMDEQHTIINNEVNYMPFYTQRHYGDVEQKFLLEKKQEQARLLKEAHEEQLRKETEEQELLEQRQIEALRNVRRNEACADTVAVMLSSMTTINERNTLASKICDILYKS